jgi:hypothetical protein
MGRRKLDPFDGKIKPGKRANMIAKIVGLDSLDPLERAVCWIHIFYYAEKAHSWDEFLHNLEVALKEATNHESMIELEALIMAVRIYQRAESSEAGLG